MPSSSSSDSDFSSVSQSESESSTSQSESSSSESESRSESSESSLSSQTETSASESESSESLSSDSSQSSSSASQESSESSESSSSSHSSVSTSSSQSLESSSSESSESSESSSSSSSSSSSEIQSEAQEDKPTFVKLWETKNPLNFIPDSTTRVDRPLTEKHILFLVAPTKSYLHGASIEMIFPDGEDPENWVCAAFLNATKVPGSEAAFNSQGIAKMQFPHYPIIDELDIQQYEIQIGKADGDGHLDPDTSEYLIMPGTKATRVILEVYNYRFYEHSYAYLLLGSNFGGIFKGCPHAANLLNLFLFADPNKLTSGYKPSRVTTRAFNCIDNSSELTEWLTHCAGAKFKADGSVAIREYIWDAQTFYGQMAGNAPQIVEREKAYWLNNVKANILKQWKNKPIGYEQWLPSANESEWYTIATPWEDDLKDPKVQDLYFSFGMVRVLQHKARFLAKKTAPNVIDVLLYRHKGYFIDLYDFSIRSDPAALEGAAVQLGYGNGWKGTSVGHIYRYRVYFDIQILPP